MHKKYFWRALFFFVFSIAVSGVICSLIFYRHAPAERGEYTFANTKRRISHLRSVKIISPESGEINLYRQDGVWRFKEANDYYVSNEMLAYFLLMLNDSTIYEAEKTNSVNSAESGLDSGTRVVLYDDGGKVTDDVIIGAPVSDSEYVWAGMGNNSQYVYKISKAGSSVGRAENWMPYPLLSINFADVAGLNTAKGYLTRDDMQRLQQYSVTLQRFFDVLNLLDYQGITLHEDVEKLKNAENHRSFEVIMKNGMIYSFEVFNIEASYWVLINLSNEKIARIEAFQEVENNRKYYDGWAFNLDDEQGKVLFELADYL